MAIKVETDFLIPVPIDLAWRTLNDVPRITPCIPGAELTEIVDERHFKGKAIVKIGPVRLQFIGEAEIYEIDEANHSTRLRARARDAKGRGNVQCDMTFVLKSEDNRTSVQVVTELILTGAVAQYGRGAALIKEITNQFTAEFVRNLEVMFARDQLDLQPSGSSRQPEAAKPISALPLLFAALRAMIARWLGLQPKQSK